MTAPPSIEDDTARHTPQPPMSATCRLAADFEDSAEDRAFGRSEGLTDAEIDRTVQDLRLWAAEAVGEKAIQSDWHATLRRFMRRDADAKRARLPAQVAPPAPTGPTMTFVHVKRDSPQGEAWWRYTREKTGKSPPTDRGGGWRFPSPWPPGFEARC